jgi:hypothetical protein
VIGLSKFTQCVLSEDKKTVDVGLGLRWLDVYKALDPYDVAVTGGRVPPVGVSGLLLGGGLSFQNSEHGFSCMGVVNYEVSLKAFPCLKILIQQTNRSFSPMGELLTPMSKKKTDLFWALKGGCANFGRPRLQVWQELSTDSSARSLRK